MVVGNIQHLTFNIPQKESFYMQKGALLQCKRTPFEIRLLSDAIS